ncbi:ATP-binding cassette domain-containing protein [Olivibacter sp. XZL3]|uniref:ABC transporter ATP-binding protein n=1 Tax=Olivibacter sp. XZL3 TaxID=1735116 RepID=UPI00106652BD|nr:ATP-binding cassette domain-containing protein [Olivibacter sp. XZL3]
MLLIRRLSKRYASRDILNIVEQRFDKGLSCIKGRNGAGKSTLLKVLAGLIDFRGEVILADSIFLKKHPLPYRRFVNFAEAEPIYPSFLSGVDLIDLFIRAKKGSVEETNRFIDKFGMQDYLQNNVSTYSAGMLKKLSILLAFIGHPKVILLDEPFITLDEAAVKQLSFFINDYIVGKQASFVVTSHQSVPDDIPVHHRFLLENCQLFKLS